MIREKINTSAIVLFSMVAAVYILACLGCANPYRVAWLTTSATVSARNATDDGIAETFGMVVKKCESEHGAKTVAFKACVQGDKIYPVIVVWRTIARPTVNSAIQATITALTLAEKSKTQNLNWISYLLPAVCAVSKIVKEYSLLFPEKAKIVLKYLAMAEGFTCPR